MEKAKQSPKNVLLKSLTGIQGFDEITGGGLPTGRPTLVCGDAGSGKTLFSLEFLIRGATEFNEPGIFMSFEETEEELTTNVASLGFDLEQLVLQRKILLDFVQIERSEIEETGEYNLEGLFVRLNHAIQTIGAKRLVLDTIESLFAGLPNKMILRAELRRLFRWLKSKGLTVIVTGEKGDGILTRQGMEEYVSDCVIVLDHRVVGQISTRRMRIVKYRGSAHGTNEYPFLIDHMGFSVLPITSLRLEHSVSKERISSGIPQLDEMMGGGGFFRGSTVLVSGTAGTGKTSLAAHFAMSNCLKGNKVLYFAFEESSNQIVRNMQSIGIQLEKFVKNGLLRFQSTRPTFYGLEMHLAIMHREIEKFQPEVVIVDPLNSFVTPENDQESRAMAIKLIDYLKSNQITGYFTTLTAGKFLEQTNIFVSSLIDTWILLKDIEISGERNRGLYILKSRGMPHSNQIREFMITANGIHLEKVYAGMDGVLTGSARLAQELRDDKERARLKLEIERRKLALERKRKAAEAEIAAIKLDYEAAETELLGEIGMEESVIALINEDDKKMTINRNVKNENRKK